MCGVPYRPGACVHREGGRPELGSVVESSSAHVSGGIPSVVFMSQNSRHPGMGVEAPLIIDQHAGAGGLGASVDHAGSRGGGHHPTVNTDTPPHSEIMFGSHSDVDDPKSSLAATAMELQAHGTDGWRGAHARRVQCA